MSDAFQPTSEHFAALGDMGDDELRALLELDDEGLERSIGADTWSKQDVRDFVEDLGDFCGDYQGIPVPLGEDMPIVLQPKHPMAGLYPKRSIEDGLPIINRWTDHKRNRRVYIVEEDGKRRVAVEPLAPDRSMERLNLWLTTTGAADAWNLEAEYKARERLREMLSDRQWMHYDLTGAFFETSERSKLTYFFRRLRPTVVLSPRSSKGEADTMMCIAVLCMHPIGYYENSWAGCMVPSDDVIAHLAMMRGDEPRYWAKAIQHRNHEAEAGL